MNPNQFKKTNNPIATFGENSQSVRDLQTQLNSQGANLQVDGMFGPLTQAAQDQYQGSSSGTPAGQPVLEPEVPVSSFSAPTGSFQSSGVTNAQNAQEDYLNSLQEPNEDQIRRNTLRQFQGQIDSVNSIYADELRRAQVAGRGRLGSQTAMSSRRGLLGSDFGESQIQGQEDSNEEVFKSIENERLAKVNFLMGKAQEDASAQIAQKRQAFVEGLDSRLAFYNDRDSRKANNTSAAVRNLLAQGVDVSELRDNELNQLANYYGISADDIKNGFASEKGIFEAEQAAADFESRKGELELEKIEADIASGKLIKLSEGNILYNTETGESFKNPKTFKPSGGNSGSIEGLTTGNVNMDSLSTAASFLAPKFGSKFQQDSFTSQVKALQNAGDVQGLKEFIQSSAIDTIRDAGTRAKMIERNQLVDGLGRVSDLLDAYAEGGGDTGLLIGKRQKVSESLGRVGSEELASIGNQILFMVDELGKSQSGAALNANEEKLYKSLFPGVNKTGELNTAKISSLTTSLQSGIDNVIAGQIGSAGLQAIQGEGSQDSQGGTSGTTSSGISYTVTN